MYFVLLASSTSLRAEVMASLSLILLKGDACACRIHAAFARGSCIGRRTSSAPAASEQEMVAAASDAAPAGPSDGVPVPIPSAANTLISEDIQVRSAIHLMILYCARPLCMRHSQSMRLLIRSCNQMRISSLLSAALTFGKSDSQNLSTRSLAMVARLVRRSKLQLLLFLTRAMPTRI